jgi:hypothetical protein
MDNIPDALQMACKTKYEPVSDGLKSGVGGAVSAPVGEALLVAHRYREPKHKGQFRKTREKVIKFLIERSSLQAEECKYTLKLDCNFYRKAM